MGKVHSEKICEIEGCDEITACYGVLFVVNG